MHLGGTQCVCEQLWMVTEVYQGTHYEMEKNFC